MEILYEVSRRVVPINKIEKTFLIWENSVLILRTDKGMNFFEFSYNLDCLEKKIDLLESFITSPKDSPAKEVCNAKFLRMEMRNVDYTEMIINPSLWPHNPALSQEMASVTWLEWSPRNFVDTGSVLAILNNIWGVEFYALQNLRWQSVFNLSPYCQKSLEYNTSPKTFDALREAASILETSAICWAPKLNADGSCYFITAQKDSTILFWQVYSNMNTVKIIGKIKVEASEIVNILMIPISDEQFWLIYADILGQIIALNIKLVTGDFKLESTHTLWQFKDKMFAHNLQYTTIDNQIIFICSKHRHLLIQLLDDNCNITSEYLTNINDYRITTIINSVDGFYLGTFNVKIFKIGIEISNKKLNVVLTPLAFKDSYSNYELHSISFSMNNLIFALALVDRKVMCRKGAYKIDIVILSTESKSAGALTMLLENPSKKLTNHWDCIAVLRYKIMKSKSMPTLDYTMLLEQGLTDVYKLKIFLLLSIFQNNLRKLHPVDIHCLETVKHIKEKILLAHVLSVLNDIYSKHEAGKDLSQFDKESLQGCKNYLAYYTKNHKSNIEIDEKTSELLKDHSKFECQCCDENVEGFTCKNGHLNMLCMLTLTPITSHDYLSCQGCGSTARSDLGGGEVLCVFCDLRLVKNYS